MSQRPIWRFTFIVAALAVLSIAPSPAVARDPQQLPCPPRARGEPKPPDCYDPCPSDMVGEQPNCSCPEGMVKAGRPEKPGQHCVKAKSPSGILEKNIRLKDVLKPCPAGKTGTPPNCHCPPGLMEPDCKPPLLIPQEVPKSR